MTPEIQRLIKLRPYFKTALSIAYGGDNGLVYLNQRSLEEVLAAITDLTSGKYKVVPVEPTEAMLDVGTDTALIHNEYGEDLYVKNMGEIYTAMLKAAP